MDLHSYKWECALKTSVICLFAWTKTHQGNQIFFSDNCFFGLYTFVQISTCSPICSQIKVKSLCSFTPSESACVQVLELVPFTERHFGAAVVE